MPGMSLSCCICFSWRPNKPAAADEEDMVSVSWLGVDRGRGQAQAAAVIVAAEKRQRGSEKKWRASKGLISLAVELASKSGARVVESARCFASPRPWKRGT